MHYLQVQQLIGELNEILAHDVVDEGGQWKKKLRNQSQQLFDFLPEAIQEQLLLERDPHGNVQVFVLFNMVVFFCSYGCWLLHFFSINGISVSLCRLPR